jgi:hypothetical protein
MTKRKSLHLAATLAVFSLLTLLLGAWTTGQAALGTNNSTVSSKINSQTQIEYTSVTTETMAMDDMTMGDMTMDPMMMCMMQSGMGAMGSTMPMTGTMHMTGTMPMTDTMSMDGMEMGDMMMQMRTMGRMMQMMGKMMETMGQESMGMESSMPMTSTLP